MDRTVEWECTKIEIGDSSLRAAVTATISEVPAHTFSFGAQIHFNFPMWPACESMTLDQLAREAVEMAKTAMLAPEKLLQTAPAEWRPPNKPNPLPTYPTMPPPVFGETNDPQS
jgi:hypothetical protein